METMGGTLQQVKIGWRDDVILTDAPVAIQDVILRSGRMVRARRHLAVERGGRRALSAAWALARKLARLAEEAASDGGYLYLNAANQTDSPPEWSGDGLGVGVRAVVGQRIVWAVSVTSWGETTLPNWGPFAPASLQRRSRTPITSIVRGARAGWAEHIRSDPGRRAA